MKGFSQLAKENLGHYVYILVDPRDNKIFYVGKGQKDRVFAHVACALEEEQESDKLNQIREILAEGKEVKHYIVRHGIEKEEIAFEIESTLIDLLDYKEFQQIGALSNIVAGHHSFDRGIKTAEEIELLYNCESIAPPFQHNFIAININKAYNEKGRKLYDAVKRFWKLNIKEAEKTEFVFAEYKGIVRGIFKPIEWYRAEDDKEYNEEKDKGRWGFNGEKVTDKSITDLYLNKQLPKREKGTANPIRYSWNMK